VRLQEQVLVRPLVQVQVRPLVQVPQDLVLAWVVRWHSRSVDQQQVQVVRPVEPCVDQIVVASPVPVPSVHWPVLFLLRLLPAWH
jgi:hypothetical protein